ncbi:MAG: exodeoxyribonuclease VII large subunit [Defluviitaleaceae bacterium]|nr:exodeoxyribonuclease VII large subunit [Defluviitaleaceae bacterium]MCL2262506.1 exodeoxyribonuclease VII large subunit [Defluviitaleaceae bacterium]
MTARTVFTVAQVNKYVKKTLEADALLAGLFVEGELSNFNAHSSGHLYFTLKDAGAAISGVMFKGSAMDLAFVPRSGMKVVVFGRLSLYEKTGQYQLYVEYMEPAGVGGLQLAFAQLKEKLEAEGLFSQERKRALPPFVNTVAIITSPTGAAVRDIIRIIRERNRAVKIILAPAIVQGENAAADLVRAIREVNEFGGADVIILGRGGGSVEDLWAFNEEILARAVADSAIPIISAVGHETDFTISDFVADLRAPTPTAAAQTAVYDQHQLCEYLSEMQAELSQALSDKILQRRVGLKTLLASLSRAANTRLLHERQTLSHMETLLEKTSPFTIFKRGYALTQHENTPITSVKTLHTGQNIKITYADGQAFATIEKIKTVGVSPPPPPQGDESP